ncbi:hypothetical protein ACFL3T_00820 [Patescibacteria group bacterium]
MGLTDDLPKSGLDLPSDVIVYSEYSLYERLLVVQQIIRKKYDRLAEQIGDFHIEFEGSDRGDEDNRTTSKVRIIMHPELVDGISGIDTFAQEFDKLGERLDSLGMFISVLHERIEKKGKQRGIFFLK